MQIPIRNVVTILALFLSPIIGICAEKKLAQKSLSPVEIPTPEEKSLLNQGEVSTPRYLGGAFLGSFIGFGLGHAVQGRFFNKGAYFLIGETAGLGTVLYGTIALCGIQGERGSSNCLWIQNIGAGIFVVFKVWEIFDLWVGPPIENSNYRDLIKKYPGNKRVTSQPFILPTSSNSMVAGLVMSF